MHAALAQRDILHEVFDTLTDELYSYDRTRVRATLLNAALTCRVFNHPALDALWKRMTDVLPLLHLIPTFREVDGIYEFEGKISSEECVQFDNYARRVRHMFYLPSTNIGSAVFFRLSQIHRTPLLPRLRSFTWYSQNPAAPEALLFIAPTLELVTISVAPYDKGLDDGGLKTFLRTLVDEVPSLKQLHLCGAPTSCISYIGAIRSLRNLLIRGNFMSADSKGCISRDMYHSIFAEMGHLVELDIEVSFLDTDSLCPPVEFKSLEVMKLTGYCTAIAYVLSTFSAPHLTCLEIRIRDRVASAIFNARLAQLSYLQTLCISCDKNDHNDPPLDAKHLFGPLLHLTQLEDLKIFFWRSTILMDNSDVESMALAWPKIRKLDIHHRRGELVPTIASFASFARRCPALTFLALPTKSDVIIPLKPPVFAHPLQVILLPETSAGLFQNTARIVDCFFPHLDIAECQRYGHSYPSLGSDEVFALIGLLQTSRRDHERRLALTG